MSKIYLYSLIIGSMLMLGVSTTFGSEKQHNHISAASKSVPSYELAQPKSEENPIGEGEMRHSQVTKPKLMLDTVCGVSLYDDQQTVLKNKGKPKEIRKDKSMDGVNIYVYDDCTVGISDDAVSYVSVTAAMGMIDIDGIPLPLSKAKLMDALGTPYWNAEDGIVYKKQNSVLKLYLNGKDEVSTIHYFHESSV